jgi:diaminopropionate ammonia-lyase
VPRASGPSRRSGRRLRADEFLTIPDALALEAVELLRLPTSLEPPIRTAPSGAAGLAALLAAVREPALAGDLGLGPGSRVLLIVSEGAQE